MKYKVHIVDAFSQAGVLTSGNPAAVCLLNGPSLPSMTDTLRQKMASDINLSETAYIEPLDPQVSEGEDVFTQQDTFKLRWFTPAIEVPLCGHATLASAAVVFEACQNPTAALHFQTLSGTLTVRRQQLESKQLLQMNLPVSAAVDALPFSVLPQGSSSSSSSPVNMQDMSQVLQAHPRLVQLLTACLQGLNTTRVTAADTTDAAQQLINAVEYVGYCSAVKYLLVVLKEGTGRQGIEQLQPDYARMTAAVNGDHMIGVIVTAAAGQGEGYDLYSRFFGPWAGITEDPVTGSAHAVLAPYWSQVLGKQQLFARQCSARGGDVWMIVGAEPGRVMVSGEATLVEQKVLEYS